MDFKLIMDKIMGGNYLSQGEVNFVVDSIKNKRFSDVEFVSLLVTIQTRNNIKGMSVEESSYFIKAFVDETTRNLKGLFCNSGTGGDKVKTINISTLASIIIASSGVKVFKNGSMGTTGGIGAKEALECIGINPLRELDEAIEEVKKVGIGYYDFSKIVPIKARPGTPTLLNYLGPLCNPAKLKYKMMGCVDEKLIKIVEPILEKTCENYMITYNPTIDEISLSEPTLIIEKKDGIRREYSFDPKKEGIPTIGYEEIGKVDTDEENEKILTSVLKGDSGPAREIACLNAGAGLYLVGKTNSIREGYGLAKKLIDEGDAYKKLLEWREAQNETAGRI